MRILMGLIGLFLIVVVLWDVFETIVLPRRVTRRFRLTRYFYRSIWQPWSALARMVRKSKRRETLLSIFGPLSLLMLLVMWAATLVFAFTLIDWERWAADLMESHLSYPALCFFRSQHDNQSWLAALNAVLDTCSLVMVGIDGIPKWQAQLTFKMVRHAIVDIAQIFNTSPLKHDGGRLTSENFIQLRTALSASGVSVRNESGDEETLKELRAMYEPYTEVLSRYLMMPLPGWLPKPRSTDNWQTSAWEVTPQTAEQPFRKCMQRAASAKAHAQRASALSDKGA